ncbi:MAG: alpha-amylase family glycosyl hydrolase [Candidatus Electryonea clarkiae]|nr:alpha-amylase family glycosyl hydrolase [Candidatus Electryonea clarkiae]MDP8285403.1 alpha-amylase family glycosyl hydrolase [Candidatus Electryonea clarkiae]
MDKSPESLIQLPELREARLESENLAVLIFEDKVIQAPEPTAFKLLPGGTPEKVTQASPESLQLEGRFDRLKSYRIKLPDGNIFPLLPAGIVDKYTTEKPLGLDWNGDDAVLRMFMPRASKIDLLVFQEPGGKPLTEHTMDFDSTDGVWETRSREVQPGRFYGYRVESPFAVENIKDVIFADPYSWAIAKKNNWQRPSLTVVLPQELYQYPSRSHYEVPPGDLVVYEAHVKDFSMLAKSVPRSLRGTYSGAVNDSKNSPLSHLKDLGINTIEWLPLADYDYYEPPFNEKGLPVYNTWNRYSTNHWGYMPAYYFAPEARYSTGASRKEGEWIGADGKQVYELREMIERMHEAGISVIVDVVYNHIAQYGENPIRQIDPQYFLRHNRKGKRVNESGCGNDLRTERPMVRRLIIDSLSHWVNFYGVDGFRFDLAGLLDEKTLDVITGSLRSQFPGLHLIAEPWGRKYDKKRFSERNWASWNDHFRDGIRGAHPKNSKAFIFGRWGSNDSDKTLLRHLTGNLDLDGGPFRRESHTLNFLGCHDGYTLADFVRVAIRNVSRISELPEYLRMNEIEAKCVKFALFILFTSRGAIMLHAGEEWGRPKWISADNVDDPKKGTLDNNSYEKDDKTNWLDWTQLDHSSCEEILCYTKGLIELRKNFASLRNARRDEVELMDQPSEFAFGYRINNEGQDIIVLLNANQDKEITFSLPSGRWKVMADHMHASGKKSAGGIRISGMTLPPVAGAMLVKSNLK